MRAYLILRVDLMGSSKLGEKREWKRLRIDCPVMLRISSRGKVASLVPGHLLDIGMGGARLQVGQHLEEGSRVVLHTHFRDAKEKVTTVRFEGIVQRADDQPVYEVAVQFRRGGRIIRDVGELLTLPPKASPMKNGNVRGRAS
jgi:hypothetical protein